MNANAAEPHHAKKAVVEHSVRLSFHNDLPKSEGSGEHSRGTIKHHPRSQFKGVTELKGTDCTQSGYEEFLSMQTNPSLIL